MHLSTSRYFQDPAPVPVFLPQANSDTGWQAVCGGLQRVALGYAVLLVGAVLGPYLIWEAAAGGPLSRHLLFTRTEQENVLLLGVAVLFGSALASYGLTLAGQWRCLMYAPERQGSKEQMFICLTCVALGLALNIAANVVGGADNSLALQQALSGLEKPAFFQRGGFLQLASAAAGLLSLVVFNQFLRTVAGCFDDRARMRQADLYLAYVGLLVGGTVGAALCFPEVTSNHRVLLGLAVAWLGCFLGQLLLIRSLHTGVQAGLRAGRGPSRTMVPRGALRGPSKVLRILAQQAR